MIANVLGLVAALAAEHATDGATMGLRWSSGGLK